EYDRSHRMTAVSIVSGPGATPQTILTNEYDSAGHVVKQTLAGIGTYLIEYADIENDHPMRLRVTTPEGEELRIVVNGDHSVALSSTVRFPHKQP
ncbi:MAG TPA: hypothetical protein VFF39_06280, partial [Verrucomicrobiae bacterium]|nr:hypothetical protein [Verrucomicrobiae bacterium]